MSRSNPNTGAIHPCKRWFEWEGGDDGGIVSYYDKEKSERINLQLPFTFILLDETATVKGWHDASESAIYSNEVRDTRQETFVVRSFKGGELASGVYASIRDRVGHLGGAFAANLYLAWRDEKNELQIGSINFKGAALKNWMEFKKQNRQKLYEKAIAITGYEQGKKGKIVFRTPNFVLRDMSEASNAKAIELDKELQAYLTAYFARPKDAAAAASKEDLAAADAEFAGGSAREDADDRIAEREQAMREPVGPALNGPARGPDGFEDSEIPF